MWQYISTILDVVAVITAIIAIVKTQQSLNFTTRTYEEGVVHTRKKDTIEAFNSLQCQALDKLNAYTDKEIEEIAGFQYSRNPEEKAKYREISGYMARIEHFCVGVVNDIYDKEIVYQLAHNYFEKALKRRISPMLKKKNIRSENNYKYTEEVFELLEQYNMKGNKTNESQTKQSRF